jgi:hypothetical protein
MEHKPKVTTEDEILGEWVYCAQHCRPHRSGWCTVSLNDKVGLGPMNGDRTTQEREAVRKCRYLGLFVY